MKNLVLGSSGFVGKYLCNYLRNKQEEVIEYDIVRNPTEDCRIASLPLDTVDRVYFLSWKVGGSNYLYNPDTQKEQLDWNIKILCNIMEQLQSVPFVFISSQLAENCDTIYGVLKRLGEVWSNLNNGVVVRLWNVYGAFEESSVTSHVIADLIHQALKYNVINLQTTGLERRQFVYIEDVCSALHQSFNYKGTYDVSSFQWNSIYEAALIISNITGCQINCGNKIGSSLFIENKLALPGWKNNYSLTEGLTKTINLFKSLL